MRHNLSSRHGAYSPVAVGSKTIGDPCTAGKRGAASAVFGVEPLIGPVSVSVLAQANCHRS